MKLTHKFAEMTPEKPPQDPHMDGTGLRIETLEHGGEYPDTMPQAIKLMRAAPASTCRSHRTGRWSTAKVLCSILRMTHLGSQRPPMIIPFDRPRLLPDVEL